MKLDSFITYADEDTVDFMHYQFNDVSLDREFLGKPKGSHFEYISIDFAEGTVTFGLDDGETEEVDFHLEAE